MEKELQDYIEKLKLRTLETKDVKKSILRIKTYLDDLFECCEDEIESGELSKRELVNDFLDEYKKEGEEDKSFQTRVTFLLSQYESCKKILKAEKKNKNELNSLISQAKILENSAPNEDLYNSINMKNQIITTLRLAIRDIRIDKMRRGQKDYFSTSQEEILKKVREIKANLSDEIKDKLIDSLQKRVSFLEEYGLIDQYINENNQALEEAGLAGISQVKRNPFPDVEYDGNGNIVNTEEFEDMGVIDVFERSNLKKYSPEELFVMEVYWKSRYFTERMEISEALSTIEFLNLWPVIMEEDESAIENLDDESLNRALKRDLALTYFIRNREAITPEAEKKYIRFLEESGMALTGTTSEDIDYQTEEIQRALKTANDLMLGQCVIVDKLKNKELEVKDWGLVESDKFEDVDPVYEKLIIAMEMPSFRGTLLFSMNEGSIVEFFRTKDPFFNDKGIRLPRYKGNIDDNYSKAMATLFLPTSVYFKKYVTQKYTENPESPLLAQLAQNFAGAKKIKPGSKNLKQIEDEVK